MLKIFDFLARGPQDDLNAVVPQNRGLIFTIKGKIAPEQTIKSAGLQGKKMVILAFTWEGSTPVFLFDPKELDNLKKILFYLPFYRNDLKMS